MTWTVPAAIVRVIDADTVLLDLDLGWRVFRNGERLRIAGLFAAEKKEPGGPEAIAYAKGLLPVGVKVKVTSQAKPSFERTVGSIELPDGRDFAQVMVAHGYGTAEPRPK